MTKAEYTDWVGFGARVRSNRKMIGLTIEKLSEMINRTENFLISVEKGDKSCSIHTIHLLSKALKVPIDRLLYGENMKDKNYTDKEIVHTIIDRCSEKEVKAIKDVIVAMYPHLEDIAREDIKSK